MPKVRGRQDLLNALRNGKPIAGELAEDLVATMFAGDEAATKAVKAVTMSAASVDLSGYATNADVTRIQESLEAMIRDVEHALSWDEINGVPDPVESLSQLEGEGALYLLPDGGLVTFPVSSAGKALVSLDDSDAMLDYLGAEPSLGIPSGNGYLLSSLVDGTRGWVAPNAHTHAISDVSGLQSALDDKLSISTSRTAKTVYAAPSGADGVPSFRLLVAADIPSLDTAKLTSGTLGYARGGTGISAPGATAGNLRWSGSAYTVDTASYALSSAIPVASSTTPAALGTAAVGTGTTWARADHVHALPTAAQVGAESALGNPSVSGYVLSSTAAGVRSWVAQPTIPVGSVFGRTGAVVAASGDYSAYYLGISATAAAATKLATGRTIGITGDATWTSPSFDGTANVSAALTLASVITAGGPTGSSSVVPVITYDAKGRLTAVTTATITPAAIGAASASSLASYLPLAAGSGSPLTGALYAPEVRISPDGAGIWFFDSTRIYKASGGGLRLRSNSGNVRPMFEDSAGNAYTIWDTGNLAFGSSSGTMCQGNDSRLALAADAVIKSPTLTQTITGAALAVERSAVGNGTFLSRLVGDAQYRHIVYADGKQEWGSGASATDVSLSRAGSGQLLFQGPQALATYPGRGVYVEAVGSSYRSPRIDLREGDALTQWSIESYFGALRFVTAYNTTTPVVAATINSAGDYSGKAATATKLATARTLTIGSTGKSFDGSANVSWTLAEIGAQAAGSYQPLEDQRLSTTNNVTFNNLTSTLGATLGGWLVTPYGKFRDYTGSASYQGFYPSGVTPNNDNFSVLWHSSNTGTYLNAKTGVYLQIFDGTTRNDRVVVKDTSIDIYANTYIYSRTLSVGATGSAAALEFKRGSDGVSAAFIGHGAATGSDSEFRYQVGGGGQYHSWYTNNGTSTAERMKLGANGFLTINVLAGTGYRPMVCDASGAIAYQDASTFRSTISAASASHDHAHMNVGNVLDGGVDPFASRGSYDARGGVRSASGAGPFGSIWYNMVDVRHRNAWGAGDIWGGELVWGMTAYAHRMAFRSRGADGSATAWTEVWSNANLTNPVNGVGTATHVAVWNSASTQTGYTGFTYDGTNLTVKGASANYYLHNGSGVSAVMYDGCVAVRPHTGTAVAFSRFRQNGTGAVIFDNSDSTMLDVVLNGVHRIRYSNSTSALVTALAIGESRSSNASTGNGVSLDFKLDVAETVKGRISALINASASRESDLVFSTYGVSALQESLRLRGSDNSAWFYGRVAPSSSTAYELGAYGNRWNNLFVDGIQLGDFCQLTHNASSVFSVGADTTLPVPTIAGQMLFLFNSSAPAANVYIYPPSGYGMLYRSTGTTITSVTQLVFNSAGAIAIAVPRYNSTLAWFIIY